MNYHNYCNEHIWPYIIHTNKQATNTRKANSTYKQPDMLPSCRLYVRAPIACPIHYGHNMPEWIAWTCTSFRLRFRSTRLDSQTHTHKHTTCWQRRAICLRYLFSLHACARFANEHNTTVCRGRLNARACLCGRCGLPTNSNTCVCVACLSTYIRTWGIRRMLCSLVMLCCLWTCAGIYFFFLSLSHQNSLCNIDATDVRRYERATVGSDSMNGRQALRQAV